MSGLFRGGGEAPQVIHGVAYFWRLVQGESIEDIRKHSSSCDGGGAGCTHCRRCDRESPNSRSPERTNALTIVRRWNASSRDARTQQSTSELSDTSHRTAREHFWKRVEVLGLWAAAAVGLVAILVSNRDAKEQLSALRGQMSAVLAGQRAWIEVTVTPSSLQFDSDGNAILAYKYKIKNVGRSVAENIEIFADAFVVDDKMKRSFTFEKQATECDAMMRKKEILADRNLGSHLFPNETYPSTNPEEWAQGFVTISAAEIKKGVAMISTGSQTPLAASAVNSPAWHPFELNFVGCAYYKLSVAEDFHQTGFVFDVYKTETGSELPLRLVEGEDVEYPHLHFSRFFGDGKIN
jgi:hypothetical protein